MDKEHPLLGEYRKKLPAKLKLLSELVEKLKEKYELDTLDQFRREVHKIAGSAGTYGFTEASELCQKLEADLIPLIKNFHHTKPKKEWLHSLDDFLEKMEKAFAAQDKKLLASPKKASERKTVVVVDDDEDLLNLLKYEFNQIGFDVKPFDNGDDALEFLLNEDKLKGVFLVVLDRMLPDMDGLDILQKFTEKFPGKIPVLIISVLDTEKDIVEGLQTGAVDYLTKPFSVFMLMQKALNLLKTQK